MTSFDDTYGLGWMVTLLLSLHLKSDIKSFCSTLGWQVRIKGLPIGFRCTLWVGKISSRGPYSALYDKSEMRKFNGP